MSEPVRANRGTVVITGASTGIGRACALRLAALGFDVFAGVRRPEDGEALSAAGAGRVTPLSLDVTSAEGIAAAAAQVRAAVGASGVAGLVNNAGITVTAPLEFVPLDEFRRQLEVNLVGQLAVTQAFLEPLRAARGRIVNMGSIGGRAAVPFVGPYSASKFALEGLTDALRQELRPWGIEVAIVEPGSIATPIWEKGAASADALFERLPPRAHELYAASIARTRAAALRMAAHGLPPERVAAAVAHALTATRPKTRYLIGRDAHVQVALGRVFPDRTVDRIVARLLRL